MTKERYLWIDWMKVLAMYLIIAGHLGVPGNQFIYVFSVPSFFILSGFLFKKESWKTFFQKSFWNLFIPMMALLFINVLYSAVINGWGLIPFIKVIFRSLVGYQGENYAYGGLGALWFVYTLLACRLLMQIIYSFPVNLYRVILLLINLLFLFICILYNRSEVSARLQFNSIINILLAFPFFTIGFLFSSKKEDICSISISFKSTLLFLFSIFLIILCGKLNGLVYLYKCSYGHYLLLCFLGGIAGSFCLFFLSKLCEKYIGVRNVIESLGQGTIIILGLHVLLMSLLATQWAFLFGTGDGANLYLFSLLLLLIFIPINSFCKKYIPILYGRLRIV